MRKLFPLLAVAVLFSGLTLAWAAEEKYHHRRGVCAKCCAEETESCQNAIVTEEEGKKVTYYLDQNAVSKKFHQGLSICSATKEPLKVKATGTVEEEEGKKVLTASKIEVVE